jgi:ADP-ribose pyrophosphatase YjhB (NUDIX family)
MFTIGAFAIILDENSRVLLCLRTDKDIWNLPGGGVEVGESHWAAVVREVKEETGLDVKINKFLGVTSKPEKSDFAFLFLCMPVSGELTLNNEAKDLRYFSLDEILENTLSKQVSIIKQYFTQKDELILMEYYDNGVEVSASKYFDNRPSLSIKINRERHNDYRESANDNS